MGIHELWRNCCIVCESSLEYEGEGVWKCECPIQHLDGEEE